MTSCLDRYATTADLRPLVPEPSARLWAEHVVKPARFRKGKRKPMSNAAPETAASTAVDSLEPPESAKSKRTRFTERDDNEEAVNAEMTVEETPTVTPA